MHEGVWSSSGGQPTQDYLPLPFSCKGQCLLVTTPYTQAGNPTALAGCVFSRYYALLTETAKLP